MKKRIISLICSIVMLAVMFTGCGDSTPAESTVGGTVESAVTVAENVDVSIIGEAIKEYKIVISEESSNEFKNDVALFRTRLSKAFGGQLGTVVDKMSEASTIELGAKEIVVGESRRPSGRMLLNKLRIDDYLIACLEGRVYILGGSEAATLEALKVFEEKYVNKTDKIIEIKGETCEITNNTDKEYPVNTVNIDGVNIRDYNIVIPENADLSTAAAAEQLSEWFRVNAGYPLGIITDSVPETEYEILIGNTNRAASKSDLKPDYTKLEYVLYKSGNKVVALGDSFMVGGGIGAITRQISRSGKEATVDVTIPTEAKLEAFKFDAAQNAILMIGDGMGFNHIDMTLPQLENNKFIAADLPNKGEAKTDSFYGETTDSAAAGTALATGYKTKNSYLGVDHTGKTLLNIRELAHSKGAKTAVVTNDGITGGTPASFLCHHTSRSDYDVLTPQINKLIENNEVTYTLGRVSGSEVGDAVTDYTKEALRAISGDNSRFFMMMEEARIDWNSHSNDADAVMSCVKSYNDTIATVIQFVLQHPDTVLVITADHETGGLVKDNGNFTFTKADHTSANVPVYAIGAGTEMFNGQAVENIEIPKFMAKAFGDNNFGQQ